MTRRSRNRPIGRVALLFGVSLTVALVGRPQSVAANDTSSRIEVAADGRTLAAPANVTGKSIRVSITGASRPSADCSSARPEAGPLIVKYRFSNLMVQPYVLGLKDKTAVEVGDGEYEIANEAHGDELLVFNVWESSADASKLEALTACLDTYRHDAESLEEREGHLERTRADAERAAAAAADTEKTITALEGDVKTFQAIPTDRAMEQIVRILAEIRQLRERLHGEQGEAEKTAAAVKAVQAKLEEEQATSGGSAGELTRKADRLSDFISAMKDAGQREYVDALVLSVGGVLVGPHAKAVNYDLADRGVEDVVTLSPIGPYPTLRFGERLFVALLNLVQARYPYPFSLQVTAQAGAVINLAPVRPVFEPGALHAGEAVHEKKSEGKVHLGEPLYRDLFLPVEGTFAPNDFAEATLVTERLDKEGQREEVKLLDKAKLPTFRALYRFNFNSGVVSSGLREPAFQKVKITDDDPKTSDENEARYRIDEVKGQRRVIPMFGFTVYLLPVDIQGPVTWRERLPNPTVGFGFTHPTDDAFVGFSHELVRNLQLFWGWHFGKVTESALRNEVSEERDATAPVTREKRDRAFVWGVTLNVNVVTKIFK